jgi:hypothetical protein
MLSLFFFLRGSALAICFFSAQARVPSTISLGRERKLRRRWEGSAREGMQDEKLSMEDGCQGIDD